MSSRKTNLTRADRDRLVRFYRGALTRIHEVILDGSFSAFERPRFGAILAETGRIVRGLNGDIDDWIETEFRPLYRGNLSWVDQWIRKAQGRSRLQRNGSGDAWSTIHQSVIDDLILRPEIGLGPRLKRAADGLGVSVRQYVMRHRALLRQVRTLNEGLADGVLQGSTTQEMTQSILQAFQGKRPRSFFGFARENPYQSLLDAPYIQIPTKKGVRRLHVEDYVRQVVVTKESEMRARATRQRSLERGLRLVQVSSNPPLVPDTCSLYVGRVFAITPEGAEATGYPLIDRCPGGGPPFHPQSHVTGTVVEGCELLAASSRNFHGEVVTIETAGGFKTTITANHPVATDHGFVGAKVLNVGDRVFCRGDRQGLFVAPNHEHGPTEVSKLVELADESGEFFRVPVPVRPEHFYGEGEEGQVAVVRVHRELWGEIESQRAEVTPHHLVVVASELTPPSGSSLGLRFVGPHGFETSLCSLWSPSLSHGIDSIFGDSLPLLWGFPGLESLPSVTPIPEPEPRGISFDPAVDETPTDSKFSSNLRRSYPGPIELDEVIRVDIRSANCQVHCLQSSSGVYSADGLIVKNCTHGLMPFVEESFEPEELDALSVNGDESTRTQRGVPVGVLDKDWGEAEKWFRSKGGVEWAARQNPLLDDREASQFTDTRVLQAIRSRGMK